MEDLRVKAEAAPKTCKIMKLGNFIISPKQPVVDVKKPPKPLSKMNPLIKTKPKDSSLVNFKSPPDNIKPKRTNLKKKEEDEEKLNDKKKKFEDTKGIDKKEEMLDQKNMKKEKPSMPRKRPRAAAPIKHHKVKR